jgi:hypothetical protein
MIRRVAFKKAVLGGVLGAFAWEVAVRSLILLGVPLFDLVHVLGTMVAGERAEIWQWWPIGMAMHAIVGAIWAIFYAYFFWSFYDFPPALQGLIFSLLPALLAGLIMIPQMDFMREVRSSEFRTFAIGIGWLGPVSVILGHLIYGAVMGSIYKRPVGYPTKQMVKWYG